MPGLRPDRFVAGLAIVAALLVVVGLVSVIIVQRQPAPRPDLTTPDGTVLAFLQAYRTGTDAQVRGFYSQRVIQEYENPSGEKPIPFPPRSNVVPSGSQRVQVLSTSVDGDRAVVDVSITTFQVDSPVSPSEYTYRSRIELVREGSQWKLDQPFFPR